MSAQEPSVPLHRAQGGFTLIELMIALVLFSFAIAGVLSVAVSVTQGYREQRQVIAAESSVRAPLDYLADALRQASPGVQDPSKVCDYQTCQMGAITVSNGTGYGGSDELELIFGSGGVVTTTTTDFSASTSTITVVDGSQLSDGDYVLITDLTNGMLVQINTITSNVITPVTKCSGTLTWPSTSKYAKGSIVVRAEHAKFNIQTLSLKVDKVANVAVPHLMMDPDGPAINNGGATDAEPLAEYIDDLQVAVGIDTDGNGTISENGANAGDDEWYFNHSGETTLPAGKSIRAVRVTLVARTSKQLFGNQSTSLYLRPAAEDHSAGASDSYRRRTLRTIVELRNISGSP